MQKFAEVSLLSDGSIGVSNCPIGKARCVHTRLVEPPHGTASEKCDHYDGFVSSEHKQVKCKLLVI